MRNQKNYYHLIDDLPQGLGVSDRRDQTTMLEKETSMLDPLKYFGRSLDQSSICRSPIAGNVVFLPLPIRSKEPRFSGKQAASVMEGTHSAVVVRFSMRTGGCTDDVAESDLQHEEYSG